MYLQTREVDPLSLPGRRPAPHSACRAAVFCTAATAQMARLVRRSAAHLLEAWSVPSDEAITVLAELVANAAEHGGADMVVRLHHCGRTLAIDVVDSGSAHPLPERAVPAPDPLGENLRGRGLPIVAALCDHLLLERRNDGSTRVLALLTTGSAHPSAADTDAPRVPATGGAPDRSRLTLA